LLPFVIAMGVGARAIVWLGPIDKVHESLLSSCRTYDSAKRGLRYSADLSVDYPGIFSFDGLRKKRE
jgi:hypothetical protein